MSINYKFKGIIAGELQRGQYIKKHDPEHKSNRTLARTVFIFLGAPGSGKGTLAEQCVRNLGFKTLSTGNLCRQEIIPGSDKAKMIAERSKKDGLIPDDIITEMVEPWLNKNIDDTPIILDGYPRTQKQAVMFYDFLKKNFPTHRLRVILLQTEDNNEIIRRISKRLICENKKCQAVYNQDLDKIQGDDVCKKCYSRLIRRDEDEESTIRTRLNGFAQHNKKIISFFALADIIVEPIIVSNTSSKEIFENFKRMINVASVGIQVSHWA